ncbi:MAG: hypothetical protein EOO63_15480 [Hymenobacter sp.]|nr:MAG: hypothetical protein EOO63_15480 [Hymenobacter sp.]
MSTLGCTKKEDPAIGTGGYTLDGRNVTCQATAATETSQKVVEYLSITLVTSPQPATGPEKLVLTFNRGKGFGSRTYAPMQLFYTSPQATTTNNFSATLTETSAGVFSGTFFVINPFSSAITNGVFTEARL